nr:YbaK/EbsC family protein [Coxiella burnetii]
MKKKTGAHKAELASEYEFQERFPGCELGAMPPFGNLFDMKVYLSKELSEEKEIVFNAGTHSQLLKLSYEDYEKLVKPTILST